MQFNSRGFKVVNNINNLRNFLVQAQKNIGAEIDFYLLGFHTFYSKRGENKYKPIHDTTLFSKNSNFTANIDIKQTYDVEILKKSDKPKRTFGFKLFPSDDTVLRAVLLCNADMQYHDSIKNDIYQELYKTMALQGYLIGIREYNKLSLQLDGFVDTLKQGKIVPKLTLNIGVGVASKEGTNGILKNLWQMQDDPSIKGDENFQPKICMQSVRKGDELFEYVKPVVGHIGRNLKGEFLEIAKVQSNAIKTDSTIRAREDSDIIKYQAARDGFLKEVKPFCYQISDELSTTNQPTQEQKPQENGTQTSLNIGGQTHSTSKIQTDIAFIGSHRGEIKAHTVVIDVLEKGSVEARVAFINSTLGGTIVADYIYIKDVRSYNEIYPRYSLVVDNILGEHNTFELNPARFAFTRRDRLEYIMLSDQIKIRLRHLKKQMDEAYAYLLASQGKAHKIQHDMEEKPDEKLPKNLQSILDQYKRVLEQYKQLLVEYHDIINLYYTNEVRLKNIDEGALLAKMMVRGSISEAETMVKFKAYASKHEETLKTVLSQSAPARFFEVIKEGDFFRLRTDNTFNPELTNWIEEMRPKQQ